MHTLRFRPFFGQNMGEAALPNRAPMSITLSEVRIKKFVIDLNFLSVFGFQAGSGSFHQLRVE
jgi:hypothetical protein